MISTVAKYVWMVAAGFVLYSLAVAVGLISGLIRTEATMLCVALLCFGACLWFTNAYLESRGVSHGWGLLANAAGWGIVSLAFLVGQAWRLPFSILAAGLIALGGIAAWLSVRERQQTGS